VTRIKCCGMTRVEDAVLAARMGVDAIGLVFTARSKRCVSLVQARAIIDALPPFVSTVALFMDDDASLVWQVLEEVRPTLLQFHGCESDTWCMQFDHPFVKAIAMGEGSVTSPRFREHPHAAAILLDGHRPGEAGGGGKTFDWSMLPGELGCPLIVASMPPMSATPSGWRIHGRWMWQVASNRHRESRMRTSWRPSFARFVRSMSKARRTSAEAGGCR
jgi:phosphoribosylanthranilate isomerase